MLLAYGGKEHSFSKEEFAELAKRKRLLFRDDPDDRTKRCLPRVVPLLDSLKKKIKIALASASKTGHSYLKMGLTPYFDAIADPAEATNGKPAPDIFLLAAKAVGLKAEECIGIEDAQAGIQAILSRRAQPIGVDVKTLERRSRLSLIRLFLRSIT